MAPKQGKEVSNKDYYRGISLSYFGKREVKGQQESQHNESSRTGKMELTKAANKKRINMF